MGGALLDSDGDGSPDIEEALLFSDPTNPDTDGDGIPDGREEAQGSDALDPNSIMPRLLGDYRFSVAGQSAPSRPGGSVLLANISAPDQFGPGGPGTPGDFVSDDYVRVIGQSTQGGTNRYAFSEFFQIRQGQTTFINDLIFTDTPPRKPESLNILPDARLMTGALGQTNRLRVIARYADGLTNDVAPKTSWTTYRVSNPTIAMVTPDGAVIARARGVVYVTAVNEGVAGVVQIAVSPNDTLTTVVGVVTDTNGVPVVGATVTTGALGMSGITDAEGRFSIAGVPTGLGPLTVTALLLQGANLPLIAISALLTPVSGGPTDAGVLVARPGFPGMALIPAGPFTMGNTFLSSEGNITELPIHTNQVGAFFMDKYEVTKALWDEVYQWATNHGYSFDYANSGQGKAVNHPAHSMTWNDAVKWCNARSEKEGRTPAYYTSAAQTVVYRSGYVSVDNSGVKWNAGFRLPTEAEWEKAARGGTSGHRFPWSDADTITHSRANYESNAALGYDTSPTRGDHPTYATGGTPYTSPVGAFAPNGYGLYDMAGNVWEWCWDWYGSYSSGSQTDPRGPTSGLNRVIRGGGWNLYANDCRSANRDSLDYPTYRRPNIGFRSVLAPGQL